MGIVNADNPEMVKKILSENETFFFDCDGVLWSTGHIFEGAVEVISKLKELKKQVVYVTNNSTKTREEYLKKIRNFGIEAELKEIFCTAYTSAQYLKEHLGKKGEVYVVGNPGMGKELDKIGIKHHGIGHDDDIRGVEFDHTVPLNPNVTAVLTGFDGFFSYSKMTKATSYLARENSLFVATNMDAQFPLKSSDYRLPGTGAMIGAIITSSGRQPTVICGKPDSLMFNCIKSELTFDPSKAIMVGDRLDTDILFGKNNNLQTMVVMSGVTSHEELRELDQSSKEEDKKLIPDYYMGSIVDLKKYIC